MVTSWYRTTPSPLILADERILPNHFSLPDITRYVNSTGTVQAVLSVSIGSFVSGPIVELNVDFNDEVKAGDILAHVDPGVFKANGDRDEANLATRVAELERVEVLLQLALNNFMRGK